MDHNLNAAQALAEAARAINSPRSLDETLDVIAHAALEAVPGFDHVGISIAHHDGKIETKAGTSQLVWELDELQYDLREGPCVDSIQDDPVVVVQHLQHDQRWPRYIPAAAKAGLRAQLGLRLYTDEETLGGLNFYSTESDTFPDDAFHIAELFATHAALALGHSRYEHQLNEAMATRKIIGQALGIIMERYQIDEQRAFQFLTRASSTSNIKLRLVAEEVVTSTNERFKTQ